VSRSRYGRYISEVLKEAAAVLPSGISLERVGHAVLEVIEDIDRTRLRLDEGSVRTADRVVLCSGILSPELPFAPGVDGCAGPRLIANPWHEAAIDRIAPDDAVLVLGSGLTMVDVAVMLADSGHRGPILALSRHGLLPRVHAPTRTWSFLAPPTEVAPTVGALMRYIRREVARAHGEGFDWRDVIDALRPHTQRLWQRLPQAERQRFLRICGPTGKSIAIAWHRRSPPGSTTSGIVGSLRSGQAQSSRTRGARRPSPSAFAPAELSPTPGSWATG
jgi:uncharacterized NAD(P)/FAD-binding protein YdhS